MLLCARVCSLVWGECEPRAHLRLTPIHSSRHNSSTRSMERLVESAWKVPPRLFPCPFPLFPSDAPVCLAVAGTHPQLIAELEVHEKALKSKIAQADAVRQRQVKNIMHLYECEKKRVEDEYRVRRAHPPPPRPSLTPPPPLDTFPPPTHTPSPPDTNSTITPSTP